MSDSIIRCTCISASTCTRDILKIVFPKVRIVREFIPLAPIYVTFTDDFEIQGRTIFHKTLPISSALARAVFEISKHMRRLRGQPGHAPPNN